MKRSNNYPAFALLTCLAVLFAAGCDSKTESAKDGSPAVAPAAATNGTAAPTADAPAGGIKPEDVNPAMSQKQREAIAKHKNQ